jgi:nucleoside-diphosphate-sugar epimerase
MGGTGRMVGAASDKEIAAMTQEIVTQETRRTALIVGASGSFGAHAAAALIKHGWSVRALARDPAAAAKKSGARMPIDWIAGDGMNANDVIAAAEGAQVIVHAANPPGYKNWRGLAMPMLAASIAAAEAHGARLVLPGNVYNYGPGAGPLIAEDAPQVPLTRKGRVRVEMEEMLEASIAHGARALILRAGDFFGPGAPNSCLNWLTRRAGGRVRAVYAPGPMGVGHCFAYLPDMAEAMARLLDREADLARFERFHFAGHWLARGDEMAAAVRAASGDEKIPLRPFPHWLLYALSPVVELFREMIEMGYLWRKPIGLDGRRLAAFLGEVPATDLVTGVRATLADMGVAGALAEPVRPAAPTVRLAAA